MFFASCHCVLLRYEPRDVGCTGGPGVHSAQETPVMSFAWVGEFSQSPRMRASATPVLASWNRKTLTNCSRHPLLRRLQDLGLLRRVGGRVEPGHQRPHHRVVVAEVVVRPGIDADVDRLGVADDGQAEVLVPEHLLQPLRPFDVDDLGLDRRPRAAAPRRSRRRAGRRTAAAAPAWSRSRPRAPPRRAAPSPSPGRRPRARSGRHRPGGAARSGCRSACRSRTSPRR